jgi:phage terminase small subunit
MLTDKQEKFCQAVALEGMSLSDAYRSAYDTSKMKDKTVNEKACVLGKKDNITARIEQLRASVASPKIMSAQERLEFLTGVIHNEGENIRNRLSAIDIMNKMQGEYVQKVEADVKREVTINIELVDDE